MEPVINLADVQTVSAGRGHSTALTRNGKVFAWGYNSSGQLGDGTRRYRSTPVAVPGLEDVISISAAGYHSMALTRDGKVFAWGYNGNLQLGDGTREDRLTPVAVPGLEDVICISAGGGHSMALTRDGNVFAWGYNEYGQLGDGTLDDWSTPGAVQDIEDVISISAGYYHSMALTSDGTVFTWGYNECGQLGNGAWSQKQSTPVAVPGIEDVISIPAAGYGHSMALTRDGNVFAWGDNEYGQLGNGEIGHGEDSEEESYSEQESDGEREEVCKYCNIPNTPEEKKWRIGHCRGMNQCLISLDDQLKNRKAVYLISPSGGKFPYKTTEILKWLKNKNTNPGSSEVIPNSRELVNSLEGIVQYQEDSG